MPELVYEGAPLRRRDEKLCLTDMWQANGSDPHRKPYEWLRLPEGRRFVREIAEREKAEESRLFEVKAGRGGGTWAHWQIGIAYAQYLSPTFHAWCNEVVRDVMEGRPMPPTPPGGGGGGGSHLTAADLIAAFDAFGRGFRGETSAVVSAAIEPVNRRLGEVESGLADNRAELAALRVDVAGGLALLREHAANKRRAFTSDTRAALLRAAHEAGGLCPCCKRSRVTNPDGSKALHTEFHHVTGRADNTPRNGLPLCRPCHLRFSAEPAAMRAEYAAEIEAFHRFRERLPGTQARIPGLPMPGAHPL